MLSAEFVKVTLIPRKVNEPETIGSHRGSSQEKDDSYRTRPLGLIEDPPNHHHAGWADLQGGGGRGGRHLRSHQKAYQVNDQF